VLGLSEHQSSGGKQSYSKHTLLASLFFFLSLSLFLNYSYYNLQVPVLSPSSILSSIPLWREGVNSGVLLSCMPGYTTKHYYSGYYRPLYTKAVVKFAKF